MVRYYTFKALVDVVGSGTEWHYHITGPLSDRNTHVHLIVARTPSPSPGYGDRSMKTKLTLLVEEKTKRKARILSNRRRISISKLFDEFVERESVKESEPFAKLDGIWKDRDITLEKIREKTWRRY